MNVGIYPKPLLLSVLRFVLVAAISHSVSQVAIAHDHPTEQSVLFSDVIKTVSRLLLEPVYTADDERLLNKAGDSAALAITKIVSDGEMNSPETGRRVLLILHLAFEAPQSIVGRDNRTPRIALRLLDQLEHTEYGRQPNIVGNARYEIKHNTSTGQPSHSVTLLGEPVIDSEHDQWLSNVLLLIFTIKPGMTRSNLLRVFTTEGGLSTRTQRTFVLKQSPIIKVDVQFSVAEKEADDTIFRISKPYLDFSAFD